MGLFSSRILIYIPAYNCSETIANVLSEIPPQLAEVSDILVLDNCSNAPIESIIRESFPEGIHSRPITVVRSESNLGYAGSQKLAYKLALQSESVEWVIMLHGDGQYPPELLDRYIPFLDSKNGIVYGYRSRKHFPDKEETPSLSALTIKTLSVLESIVTGYNRLEWHTGFLMHSTRFLSQVDLDALTSTPHIDGHLLFAAGVLREDVAAIPIYKRYKLLQAFEGAARRRYVLDVLRLMFLFRKKKSSLILKGAQQKHPMEFTIRCYPENKIDAEKKKNSLAFND